MKQVLHERTIRLIPILILLAAVALVVPAMADPDYTPEPVYMGVEINSTEDGNNWVILKFDKSVGWKQLDGDNDVIVKVDDNERNVPNVPARSGLDPVTAMDLLFDGDALEHGQTVNVTLTAQGAGKIFSLVSFEAMDCEAVSQEVTYLVPPEFVGATTNIDGNEIIIKFDKEMALDIPTSEQHEQFNFTIGEEEYGFSAAHLNGMEIVLTCDGEIAFGDVVNVSYVKGTVISGDGGALQSFTKEVDNLVPEPPEALYANTTTDGNAINITFSKEMTDPAGKEEQFTFFVNDVE